MNLENCFNTMLEYGEAVKSSFVKGRVSDWPTQEEDQNVAPASLDEPLDEEIPAETGEPTEEE